MKSHVVQALSNAELYSSALVNIYADPKYRNQDHYGILQALASSDIHVAEQNNTKLTATILMENSPLKMVSLPVHK
jgi:hypothetical protein